MSFGSDIGDSDASGSGRQQNGPHEAGGVRPQEEELVNDMESEAEEEGIESRLCPDCVCVHNAYSQIELDAQHRVAAAKEEAQKWRQAAVQLAEDIQNLPAEDPTIQQSSALKGIFIAAQVLLTGSSEQD